MIASRETLREFGSLQGIISSYTVVPMLEKAKVSVSQNRLPWLQDARKLMGEVHTEQFRFVDCYLSYPMGMILPVLGPCMVGLKRFHAHPAYSFDFALDDTGQLVIGNKTIQTKRGRFYALYPGVRHHQIRLDNLFHYIAVFIDKDFFEQQWAYYQKPRSDIREITFSFSPRMIGLLKDFMNEHETQLPARQIVLHCLATEITHEIIRKMLGLQQPTPQDSKRREINRVLDFIHAHFDRDLYVEDLARQACMSPSNFSRVFRNEVGRSPGQYLLSIRLDRARKLLLAGIHSVTEVALRCGFGTLSHFSIHFSKRYGTSPSAYRKTFQ